MFIYSHIGAIYLLNLLLYYKKKGEKMEEEITFYKCVMVFLVMITIIIVGYMFLIGQPSSYNIKISCNTGEVGLNIQTRTEEKNDTNYLVLGDHVINETHIDKELVIDSISLDTIKNLGCEIETEFKGTTHYTMYWMNKLEGLEND